MKKHSKILIGFAISTPLVAVAIATPLALMSNQSTSNSVISDTIANNTTSGLSDQVIFNSCEFEMVNPSEADLTNELKITLTGQNLDQVQKQDLTIVNKTTNTKYLGSQDISSLTYDPKTFNLEARLVSSDIQEGNYVVTYTRSVTGSSDSNATPIVAIENSLTLSEPTFAAANYGVWFNWGDPIKLQLMGGKSLNLSKTNVKIELENNVDVQKSSSSSFFSDVTDKFDVKVSNVYLVLNMKPNLGIALENDAKLKVTLTNINGTGNSSSKKFGIFSKTKTVVKEVKTDFGENSEVTLTVFGQALPIDNESVLKKLVIIIWTADSSNDSGINTFIQDYNFTSGKFVQNKFQVQGGSTSERLILKGTFEDAKEGNCRFDVRVNPDFKQ